MNGEPLFGLNRAKVDAKASQWWQRRLTPLVRYTLDASIPPCHASNVVKTIQSPHQAGFRAARLAQALIFLSAAGFCQEVDPTWTIFEWEDHFELQGGWFDDPDGDGLVNYVEFGYGLDPLVKEGSGLHEIAPRVSRAPDGTITVRLWQPDFPDNAGFGADAYGRHWFWIELQSSTDLESWETIAEKAGMNHGFYSVVAGVQTGKSAEGQRIQIDITDSRVSGPGARYYRLRYTLVS